MKTIISILGISVLILSSCSSQSSKATGGEYEAARFASLIDSLSNEQLVDVRTAAEYSEGHIKGATNIDWNGNDFGSMAGMLDKNKPVLVYCRSGKRSGEAADWLNQNGFKIIYQLKGGANDWSAAGLALEQDMNVAESNGEVTTAAYASKINAGKVVLADFGATWCGPCKILAPRLEELEKEMAGQFELVKLDSDRDANLADSMNITALPTLFLYKDGKLLWRNEGLVPKELVEGKLKEAIGSR